MGGAFLKLQNELAEQNNWNEENQRIKSGVFIRGVLITSSWQAGCFERRDNENESPRADVPAQSASCGAQLYLP
jgi:hypothetical protein